MRRAAVPAILCAILAGCGEGAKDARQTVLEERRQYGVELLSWAEREDGSLVASLRITGPVHTTLKDLTVEFVRSSADGSTIGSDWVALDLRDWKRGTPVERTVFLPADSRQTEALAVRLHPNPSPDLYPRLKKELDGLAEP